MKDLSFTYKTCSGHTSLPVPYRVEVTTNEHKRIFLKCILEHNRTEIQAIIAFAEKVKHILFDHYTVGDIHITQDKSGAFDTLALNIVVEPKTLTTKEALAALVKLGYELKD